MGFSSLISIFSVGYTVVFVVVKGIIQLSSSGVGKNVNFGVNLSTDLIVIVPLLCFAYQCHIHATPIYFELKDKSLPRMGLIISISMFICFLLYSLVGIFGYLTFGNLIQGNIMSYYNMQDIFVTIGLFCIGITVILSYPIHSFTARQTVQTLFFKNEIEGIDYIFVTLLIVILSWVFALFVPGILEIFGLMGSIGSVSLMFVFPGLILFKLSQKLVMKVLAIVLILFGLLIGISGTVITIIEMVNKRKK